MSKILIFGNSGSGKSTLAKYLAVKENCAHLDLDVLAWLPTSPPQRKPINDSKEEIEKFISQNDSWVIEGCYTDLLELTKDKADEIIFLNLSAEDCIVNAVTRPWEPHKYKSKEEQDSNLDMLIDWIKQYYARNDVFSFNSHQKFYDSFHGKKTIQTTNKRVNL